MSQHRVLMEIVFQNAVQYVDNEYSESSVYLYGNFGCFYTKHNIQGKLFRWLFSICFFAQIALCFKSFFWCYFVFYFVIAWPIKFNVWTPFLTRSAFNTKISGRCGFDTTDMMCKLHSTNFHLTKAATFSDLITDRTETQQLRNSSAVIKLSGPDNAIGREKQMLFDIDSRFTTTNGNVTSLTIALICIGTIITLLTCYKIVFAILS